MGASAIFTWANRKVGGSASSPRPAGAGLGAMSLGDVAALLLVAVLTGAAFWRGHFWVGLILLALLSGMGLLL